MHAFITQDSPTVFAFHGTGGDEHPFAALAADLWPHAGLIAPRGHVSEHGANRFFRRTGEGRSRMGWADAFYSFSFDGFNDPTRIGFARMCVLNADTIVPGAGFAPHDHADMDILTLVLSGRIRHQDSLGNTAEIAPGEMQLMRAGSGVTHSEVNASDTDPAHVLQIWLIPDHAGGEPSHQSAPLADGLLA